MSDASPTFPGAWLLSGVTPNLVPGRFPADAPPCGGDPLDPVPHDRHQRRQRPPGCYAPYMPRRTSLTAHVSDVSSYVRDHRIDVAANCSSAEPSKGGQSPDGPAPLSPMGLGVDAPGELLNKFWLAHLYEPVQPFAGLPTVHFELGQDYAVGSRH